MSRLNRKNMRFVSRIALVVATTASVAVVAGCGGSSRSSSSNGASGGSSGHGTLTVGLLDPFTGPNAFFGPSTVFACKAAANQINPDGGVMGNSLKCAPYDDKGDPADAVPVATHMLAFANHLTMVVGPGGTEMPAVLPILKQGKVPTFNVAGDPLFDHQTSPYFWRVVPSDSSGGAALAWWAIHKGYTRIVSVFTKDPAAQTTAQPFIAKYKQLGGTILSSLTIASDSASYQTEVARGVGAHAQAIVGEMDPRTAATFLSEWQQQGKLLPMVLTQDAEQAPWVPAVGPAIGISNVQKYIQGVGPNLSLGGPGFNAFKSSLVATGTKLSDGVNPFIAAYYDGIIIGSLAMNMAKTTTPADYVKDIPLVTSAKAGAVVVHTYKAGVAALGAGKKIQYVGASGAPLVFDQYGTAGRPYTVSQYSVAKKAWEPVASVPASAATS